MAKRILTIVLTLCMVLGTMSFSVFAAEPNTSGDIINVDASNAQDVLDGKYGSINGKTINFTENITEVLDLARPTKYEGSDTTYYKYDSSIPGPEPTATEWSENISSVMNSHSHYYRTLSDVTFTADDGVSVAGFTFSAGHVASSGYDYVRDVEQTAGVTYYKHSSLDNIIFRGLTVTGQFDAKLYLEGCTVESITFDGCTFTGATDDGSNAAIKFLADNQYFTDVTVENCSIDGYNQGVYIAGIDGASVINNNISNTVHNAIALQSCDGDNPAKGTIVVEENYITNVSNRAIRMNYVGDADIAINNNIMVNCGDEEGQLIKATSVADEATVDLEANYWDGKNISVAVPGFTAPTTVGVTGGTWDTDISDYVADGFELNVNGDVVEFIPPELVVATVDGEKFDDIQEAITAASPDKTVEIKKDITVDRWVMFAQNLTIGNDQLITLDMDGLTINGNGHTLTVNSIESASNGNRLFSEADNINIYDWTINIAEGIGGGISLTSGVIDNVTFNGGNCIFPGTGDVEINGCTFNTENHVIYYEEARDNLVVTENTFNVGANGNVIILRGNESFTNNTINSGRTVNVASGSPTVSGNEFADGVRLKVYNNATAAIEDNVITNLVFNDETPVQSTFESNTLSEEAYEALKAVNETFVETNKKIAFLAEAPVAEIYAGRKLSDARISGGKVYATVSGDVYSNELSGKWAFPVSISEDVMNTADYKEIVFTPDDNSYEEISVAIYVTVRELASRPSASVGGTGGSTTPVKVTVKFETNGGSEMEDVKVEKGEAVEAPKAPEKENNIFIGWFADKELTKEFDFDTEIKKATTIYAGWVEITAENSIKLRIESKAADVFGERVGMDVAPLIVDARTMLPARFVAESLGANVDWDEENQKVTITKDETVIEIFIGKDYAMVDGKEIDLDAPAFIENSRTYTPVRFISENLGAYVDWDGETKTVTIVKVK